MNHAFSLGWPPSVNHYWVQLKRPPYRVPSKQGALYRQQVHQDVQYLQGWPRQARLAAFIVAHPPDRRERDLDNLLKATFDSLQHAGMYVSDTQLHFIQIQRGVVYTDGLLDILIGDLADLQPTETQTHESKPHTIQA